MRAAVCLIVAIGLAPPAVAQSDRASAAFWKSVQANCTATAAKPPSELGQRIAKSAIDEFNLFGGHSIDSNGQLFRFGLTEAEHNADDGAGRKPTFGQLGWWRVMKYWRVLFGDNSTTDKLEVRGYRDASTVTQDTQEAELLSTSAAELLRLADKVPDPAEREVLRETALRGAVVDTPWSAAFVSYVVRQAGVAPTAFKFANAHRAYIYDAFAVSAAELNNQAVEQIYRACPLAATKPRPGDIICEQREPMLADDTDAAVRERIRTELAGNNDVRSVRRTHCEVVAHVDARSHKLYTIGGNVNQAVTARKLNLRRNLKFLASQRGDCRSRDRWTLPRAPGETQHKPGKCSLNDKKWFVLLQVR